MRSSRLKKGAWHFLHRESGSAAVEFAIWAMVLVPIVANVIDLGVYAFQRVQVSAAAQAAAQAAWSTWYGNSCTYPTKTVTNCGGTNAMSTGIGNAIKQSTVLGLSTPAPITEITANETQGYYCPRATTYALTSVATATTCPSTSANQGAKSGYYYKLEVAYTYHAMFGAASVVSLLGSTVTEDTWIRLQ